MHVNNFWRNDKRMRQLQSGELKREQQTKNQDGEKRKSELQALTRGTLREKLNVRRVDEEGGSLWQLQLRAFQVERV